MIEGVREQWLRGLIGRVHKNKVIVALAGKLARIAWAVLRSGESYGRAADNARRLGIGRSDPLSRVEGRCGAVGTGRRILCGGQARLADRQYVPVISAAATPENREVPQLFA